MKKDKKWIKEALDKLTTGFNGRELSRYEMGRLDGYTHASMLFDELDEPEKTLEQEAVDELIKKYSKDEMSTYDVKVERERFVKDLQNLLVPKQDKPVQLVEEYFKNIEESKEALEELGYVISEKNNIDLIESKKVVLPKFVADWIEEKLPKSSTGTNTTEDKIYIISRLGYGNGLNTDALYQGRDYEFNNKLNRDLVEYVSNNKVKVIRALIDGYEVEKEKKYYVLNNFGRTILVKLFGKQIAPSQGMKLEDLGSNNSDYQFTEQEIKNYDKRYWQFAEEVME